MRKVSILFLGLFLALGAVRHAHAGERDMALAVVERGITAHGGDSALARVQITNRTGKGVMTLFGKELPFTDEMAAHLPDRLRVQLDVGEKDQKARHLMVVNGDKGWQSSGGAVAELSKERVEEMREEAYILWLATLLPLKKDSAFDLKPLPESKALDRPAIGVQVIRKGHADVKLYFDKSTGLLVKMQRQATESGRPVDKEYLLTDHKDFDGVKLAGKQTEMINGQKFIEVTFTSYKFPRLSDESVFGKP